MTSRAAIRVLVVPWRKICATLPLVALVGASVAFAGPFSPSHGNAQIGLAHSLAAVVVPGTALTMVGDVPRGTSLFLSGVLESPFLPQSADSAPGLTGSNGAQPGTSAAVALDSTGIPVRALDAYRAAALAVGAADPACHIDWALLAAFGRVESNHARFGGNQLDAAGVARPGIIGIALDGTNGTARITDTDSGTLDRDTIYDRAVGPMQFIPSTWMAVGVDSDGDGVKDPQDMADAVSATAIYVCSGPGDLSLPSDLHAAILRYNNSDSYARAVTAIAAAYRLGVVALPAVEPPPATAVFPSRAAEAGRIAAAAAPVPTAAPAPPAAPVLAAARVPVAPVPASVPAAPQGPTPQAPVQPAAIAPVPAALPTPTDACALITPPTNPTPSGPAVDPLATWPCVPQPCLPNPTSPGPTSPTPANLDPTTPIPTQSPALGAPPPTPGTAQTCTTTAPPGPAPIPTP